MNKRYRMKTFQFTHKGKPISPVLVPINEYKKHIEDIFDGYTAQSELMLRSNKTKLVENAGLESHPGTKIGMFFKDKTFSKPELYSWYVKGGSATYKKLVKCKLCTTKDNIPISKDESKQNTVRFYTLDQIQLYIQQVLDKQYSVAGEYLLPENVVVKDVDDLVKPEVNRDRKKLF